MGDKTGIEWTDATWNPVRGCSRISPGCEHCYAETMAGRFAGPGQPYEGLVRLAAIGKHGRARWTGVVRLVPEHLADPLKWKKPRRIFVNSMSDLFHENLSHEEIAAVFGVMAAATKHTFQMLTKRAARMKEWFAWLEDAAARSLAVFPHDDVIWRRNHVMWGAARRAGADLNASHHDQPWPLPNVWLGVSAEDQQRADERIPLLLETPAAVRFVSYEPALGPVDFARWLDWPWFCQRCRSIPERHADTHLHCHDDGQVVRRTLDWIIAGAESGPGARPMDEAWVRSVRDQCAEEGVAFMLKQFATSGKKVSLPLLDGKQWAEFPR
jgi:protein gp37